MGVKVWVSQLTRVVALTTIIINVENAVYRHVNDKIAQLLQQILKLGFFNCSAHCQCQRAIQLKIPLLILAILVVRFCRFSYILTIVRPTLYTFA